MNFIKTLTINYKCNNENCSIDYNDSNMRILNDLKTIKGIRTMTDFVININWDKLPNSEILDIMLDKQSIVAFLKTVAKYGSCNIQFLNNDNNYDINIINIKNEYDKKENIFFDM
jgi:hypothetical protein